MRSIALFLFIGACALVASDHHEKAPVHFADSAMLSKQKIIFDVFQHIHQNNLNTELRSVADSFFIDKYIDHFEKPEVVTQFLFFVQKGLLPMNAVFSIMNEYHREQVIALFHVFYYAKDWDTFYKSMAWARFNVNEGMFTYALTVAVLHRPDMTGFTLPAPYEIYPFYFFNAEVIQEAQAYKMQGFDGMKKVEGTYTVIIPANYTINYESYMDSKLSYFTEDIGLNAYYYYFHMDYPFWMDGAEFGLKKDRRGELYMYQHQQILARYYMERLSHGYGDIPELSFYEPIKTGYNPTLRYYNGEYFAVRANYYNAYQIENGFEVNEYMVMERRIRDLIDAGFVVLADGTHVDLTKPESIDYIGTFLQGNPDTTFTRFYGYLEVFARLALRSFAHDGKRFVPGALEHFETSLRDPVFYQLYSRIMYNYYWATKHYDSYDREDIIFKGVKIESVEMDKLITYFDKFDSDITNAVDVELFTDDAESSDLYMYGRRGHYEGEDIVIKARQWRLNHVPFKYAMNVNSDRKQKALVKVFLGPKFNEFGAPIDINENRQNFFEIDYFMYDLETGKNTIERSCTDFTMFAQDRTTYFELYKTLMMATKSSDTYKFPLDTAQKHNGFPWRLMLPRGNRAGMPFQFFFYVMPYDGTAYASGWTPEFSSGVGSGSRYMSTKPFGYPLDREIDLTEWYTPNMFYYDTMIFHKKEMDF